VPFAGREENDSMSGKCLLSIVRGRTALVCGLILIICVAALKLSGQEKKPWHSGTIIEVKPHEVVTETDPIKQYDITVKIGKKIYVALYVPEKNEPELEYYVGMARTMQVDGDTLKVNDLLGRTHSLKILSSKDAPSATSK
jgi:hypothetical protein